ncbi:MAG: hypothetical protein RUMPE_01180 [Eubacteriales bacterium SKADARSKE-1]|nr:hypothetical protein [Eubacteriales bacterium SKADARSKE-1]
MTINKNVFNGDNLKMSNIAVSVIIPVRNEENYIEHCIDSVIAQDFPKKDLELILVDGLSCDRTAEIIRKYMKKYDFIKLLSNPRKTVQCALNIGIKNAVGTYIVRMDAHSEYATDYVSKCIEYLEKTKAQNVGGPMVAQGKTNLQKVIAAAYESPFALGGGKFHDENFEGYADTVYLGSFKKSTLEKLEVYDERLPCNEDDDLNFRIIENGGKIFITPQIKSIYYPRSSYKDLFKQYFKYGFWKVAVIKKHKKPARLSHLVPVSFALFIILFLALSPFWAISRKILLSVLVLYLFLDTYYSFKNERASSIANKFRLVFVHFILHISYGLGFLAGIFKFLTFKF